MSAIQLIAPYLQDQLGVQALQLLAQKQPSLDSSFKAYCQWLANTNQLQNNQIPQQKVAEFAELMKANILVAAAQHVVQQQQPQIQQTLSANYQYWQQLKQQLPQPQMPVMGQQMMNQPMVNQSLMSPSFPTTVNPMQMMQPVGGGSLLSTVNAPPPQQENIWMQAQPPAPQPVTTIQPPAPVPVQVPAPAKEEPPKHESHWVDNKPWDALSTVVKFTGDPTMDKSASAVLARLAGVSQTPVAQSQRPATPTEAIKVALPVASTATSPQTLQQVVSEVLLAVHQENLSGHTSRFISRCVFAYSKNPEQLQRQKKLFKDIRTKGNRKEILNFIATAQQDTDRSPEEKVMAIMLGNTFAKRLTHMVNAVANLRAIDGAVVMFKSISSADGLLSLLEMWSMKIPGGKEQLAKRVTEVFREWLTEKEDGIYEDIAAVGWPIEYRVLNLDLTKTKSYMLSEDNISFDFIHKQQMRLCRAADEQDFKPKVFYHVTLDGTLLELVPSRIDSDEYVMALADD